MQSQESAAASRRMPRKQPPAAEPLQERRPSATPMVRSSPTLPQPGILVTPTAPAAPLAVPSSGVRTANRRLSTIPDHGDESEMAIPEETQVYPRGAGFQALPAGRLGREAASLTLPRGLNAPTLQVDPSSRRRTALPSAFAAAPAPASQRERGTTGVLADPHEEVRRMLAGQAASRHSARSAEIPPTPPLQAPPPAFGVGWTARQSQMSSQPATAPPHHTMATHTQQQQQQQSRDADVQPTSTWSSDESTPTPTASSVAASRSRSAQQESQLIPVHLFPPTQAPATSQEAVRAAQAAPSERAARDEAGQSTRQNAPRRTSDTGDSARVRRRSSGVVTRPEEPSARPIAAVGSGATRDAVPQPHARTQQTAAVVSEPRVRAPTDLKGLLPFRIVDGVAQVGHASEEQETKVVRGEKASRASGDVTVAAAIASTGTDRTASTTPTPRQARKEQQPAVSPRRPSVAGHALSVENIAMLVRKDGQVRPIYSPTPERLAEARAASSLRPPQPPTQPLAAGAAELAVPSSPHPQQTLRFRRSMPSMSTPEASRPGSAHDEDATGDGRRRADATRERRRDHDVRAVAPRGAEEVAETTAVSRSRHTFGTEADFARDTQERLLQTLQQQQHQQEQQVESRECGRPMGPREQRDLSSRPEAAVASAESERRASLRRSSFGSDATALDTPYADEQGYSANAEQADLQRSRSTKRSSEKRRASNSWKDASMPQDRSQRHGRIAGLFAPPSAVNESREPSSVARQSQQPSRGASPDSNVPEKLVPFTVNTCDEGARFDSAGFAADASGVGELRRKRSFMRFIPISRTGAAGGAGGAGAAGVVGALRPGTGQSRVSFKSGTKGQSRDRQVHPGPTACRACFRAGFECATNLHMGQNTTGRRAFQEFVAAGGLRALNFDEDAGSVAASEERRADSAYRRRASLPLSDVLGDNYIDRLTEVKFGESALSRPVTRDAVEEMLKERDQDGQWSPKTRPEAPPPAGAVRGDETPFRYGVRPPTPPDSGDEEPFGQLEKGDEEAGARSGVRAPEVDSEGLNGSTDEESGEDELFYLADRWSTRRKVAHLLLLLAWLFAMQALDSGVVSAILGSGRVSGSAMRSGRGNGNGSSGGSSSSASVTGADSDGSGDWSNAAAEVALQVARYSISRLVRNHPLQLSSLAEVASAFQVGLAQLATLRLSFLWGEAGGLMMGAVLTDFGRRRPAVFALIGSAIVSLIAGFSKQVMVLTLTRGLIGTFTGIYAAVVAGTIIDLFSSSRSRLAALCLTTLLIVAGQLAGPYIALLVTRLTSWSWLYWISTMYAGIHVGLLALLAKETAALRLFRKRIRAARHAGSPWTPKPRQMARVRHIVRHLALLGWRTLFTHPVVALVGVLLAFAASSLTLVLSGISVPLIGKHGFTAANVSLLVATSGALSLPFALVVAWFLLVKRAPAGRALHQEKVDAVDGEDLALRHATATLLGSMSVCSISLYTMALTAETLSWVFAALSLTLLFASVIVATIASMHLLLELYFPAGPTCAFELEQPEDDAESEAERREEALGGAVRAAGDVPRPDVRWALCAIAAVATLVLTLVGLMTFVGALAFLRLSFSTVGVILASAVLGVTTLALWLHRCLARLHHVAVRRVSRFEAFWNELVRRHPSASARSTTTRSISAATTARDLSTVHRSGESQDSLETQEEADGQDRAERKRGRRPLLLASLMRRRRHEERDGGRSARARSSSLTERSQSPERVEGEETGSPPVFAPVPTAAWSPREDHHHHLFQQRRDSQPYAPDQGYVTTTSKPHRESLPMLPPWPTYASVAAATYDTPYRAYSNEGVPFPPAMPPPSRPPAPAPIPASAAQYYNHHYRPSYPTSRPQPAPLGSSARMTLQTSPRATPASLLPHQTTAPSTGQKKPSTPVQIRTPPVPAHPATPNGAQTPLLPSHPRSRIRRAGGATAGSAQWTAGPRRRQAAQGGVLLRPQAAV